MVGNAGKTANWVRDYRTPSWLRVAWRNTRSLNRFLFKRKGLKRTRAVLYLMAKPVRRTTFYVKFRHWFHRNVELFEQGDQRRGTKYLKRRWSLLNTAQMIGRGYWNAFKLGIPMYNKADFTRTTGFTSQGESYMMDPPDLMRTQDTFYTMPVVQAKAILDISTQNYYPRIVDRNFARIFMANQISNGGSWYILCRIYCAKRVLDREMRDLGIRDPPHLRPDPAGGKPDAPDPLYKDPTYEDRMAQDKYEDDNAQGGRRSTVNSGYKSTRKSRIDPRHGSKYGFSTSNFGRQFSTSVVTTDYTFDQGIDVLGSTNILTKDDYLMTSSNGKLNDDGYEFYEEVEREEFDTSNFVAF